MGMDRATLLDIAKATDPDGRPAKTYEIINQMSPILQDGPAYPSNAQLAERTTLRSSLPTVQFGRLNQGTVRSKGSTRQVVDTIAFVDGLSEVDCRIQEVIGTSAVNAQRMREDRAFLEAMQQLITNRILYGNELTSPEEFTGLAPRMSSLATAITGSQVHSMAADQAVVGGDGTSIYIVDWGEDGAHFIYPRDGDATAGMKSEDHGKIYVSDADSNPMMAYVSAFTWFIGLTVKDPRHIARLANIDVSDSGIEVPLQGQLVMKLLDIMSGMPEPNGMQRVLYTSRNVRASFWKQALNKSNVALSIEEYHGKPTAHFMGYPIRALDQMSEAESTVS